MSTTIGCLVVQLDTNNIESELGWVEFPDVPGIGAVFKVHENDDMWSLVGFRWELGGFTKVRDEDNTPWLVLAVRPYAPPSPIHRAPASAVGVLTKQRQQ